MATNIWECSCGNVAYGDFPPEECAECWKPNCFIEVPEDRIEEMRNTVFKKIKSEDEEN